VSGALFNTSVLLDIATADPVWLPWSESRLRVRTYFPAVTVIAPP
jgi:hypothetical protein